MMKRTAVRSLLLGTVCNGRVVLGSLPEPGLLQHAVSLPVMVVLNIRLFLQILA